MSAATLKHPCFSCPAELPRDDMWICQQSQACIGWLGPMCLGCLASHRLTQHHPSYIAHRMLGELLSLASMEAGWQLCRKSNGEIDSLAGRQDYLGRRLLEH